MASSPTYESYCRERKATVDKHRFEEHGRPMSEVVDEILEIISTDEDVLRQEARRGASLLTTESSYATWSLSSSAIMTSWPSGSSLDDNDDEDDTVHKSIQSYTSPLFSPLYEVRPDQQNVFQENRQPLPKAGHTPKVTNLCYNLAADISYDDANEYSVPTELPSTSKKFSSVEASSKTQRAHNATERILHSVSNLSVLTNPEINKRDTNVDQDKNSSFRHQHLSSDPKVENDEHKTISTSASPGAEIADAHTHNQLEHIPLVYDDIYARRDWVLKSYSSADTGELSLEPLLNAYSEDFDPEERLIADRQASDDTEERCKSGIAEESADTEAANDIADMPSSKTKSIEEANTSKHETKASFLHENVSSDNILQLTSMQCSLPNTKLESKEMMLALSQGITIQAFEKICIQQHAYLQRIALDVPLTPSLLHAVDKSLMTLQSTIAKSLLDCSVLNRLEAKRISMEEQTIHTSNQKDLSIAILDQASMSDNNSCCALDVESFCIQNADYKHPSDKEWVSSRPHDHQLCEPSEKEIDSLNLEEAIIGAIDSPIEKSSGNVSPHETIDLAGSREDPIIISDELESDIAMLLQSSRSSDSNSDDIVDKFLRAIEGDGTLEFDDDHDDENTYSISALPKSFDSEQFMRDMAVRLEAELTSVVGNHYDDDNFSSVELQQLSLSLPSTSCESNDGLDEEISALDMFGAELKNELAKANDESALIPFTSPMHTLQSPQLSTYSMTTTFLSENNALSCMSSEEFFPPPNVRKVHFNEQVEEFLYLAHEACGTPDAKEAERQKMDETFMDEICNVFDEIVDELSMACVSISRAMDRTRYLPKSKAIRRSSVS